MDPGELECDCFFSLEIPMGLGITCCLQSHDAFHYPEGSFGFSPVFFQQKQKEKVLLASSVKMVFRSDTGERLEPRGGQCTAAVILRGIRGVKCLTSSLLHLKAFGQLQADRVCSRSLAE